MLPGMGDLGKGTEEESMNRLKKLTTIMDSMNDKGNTSISVNIAIHMMCIHEL